jgi:transketolase
LPTLDRSRFAPASGVARGAYVLAEAEGGPPDVILIGTGSEVALCLAARDLLAARQLRARVVSMPSWELFERQDRAYREAVLPAKIRARVAVEAAASLGWERYVGAGGAVVGLDRFGESAPIKDLMEIFGFTPAHVADVATAQIEKWPAS